MSRECPSLWLTVTVFSVILALQALASTDPLDVMALQDMYMALNNPPQLNSWRLEGGDPCGESWTGVSCSGSSVIYLKLSGLELGGHLGNKLSSLRNLKHLDVSSNNVEGEIPTELPPNATHINMASNKLSQNIPQSLPTLKRIRHLNLSHNLLSGPIGNVFAGLQNLKELDLSYNNFEGDLPSSFGSLKSLSGLFLQNNKFTGSVVYLADLPLTELNIEDNDFSGVIPKQFQSIPNLYFWGNKFHVDPKSPPWDFPLDTLPIRHNISSPPTSQSSAVENFPSIRAGKHNNKGMSSAGIACTVGGVALIATCAALFTAIRISRARILRRKSLEKYSSTAPEDSPQILAATSPFYLGPRRMPPVRTLRTETTCRRSFSTTYKLPPIAKLYTVAELQSATNNFSEEKLLGQGSLGYVYKAEFPDGQTLAVKNINMVSLSFQEEEQFMDVIRMVSQLRHPNIVTLLGYCVEHGEHLLVYEFVRNLSLAEALHNQVFNPLSWTIRLRIALGIARALNYLHSSFSPPVAHCNIKASNILLDEELMPRISDCGIAILRPLTSNSASELAINQTGYIAPDNVEPGSDNTKCDIYAFGVILLELLTGRRPIDCSRSRGEFNLVTWASSRLHDREYLEQMVDPGIKGTFPSKTLSQFADIISLCILPEKEFRPPISEIVESLTRLCQRFSLYKSNSVVDGIEVDPFERSFMSTHTRFISSPTVSYLSV
ncbi:protein STRUBBELIG-RECEPTOR FAMILY 2 [Mangifera indica]|uniref:protein STRUBBELIG-RECEPTOR FAMILY 2 n=1 Tax=Mangifera indica TaxID=29780 RepID=UPI001CF9AA90|nr:protein STRUBBELIG-RECEPTOR FAMILY 2 [Mangifera indica]